MKRTGIILLVEDNQDDIDLTLHAFEKSRIANEVVVPRTAKKLWPTCLRPALTPIGIDDLARRGVARPEAPKLDGLGVLRRIRADERTRRLPVVVLTSSNEERDIVTSYDLGANSFVRKPVDLLNSWRRRAS